jgi:hypothetical protein
MRRHHLSIERFGFSNPMLIADDGEIVAGHGRVAAARPLCAHRPFLPGNQNFTACAIHNRPFGPSRTSAEAGTTAQSLVSRGGDLQALAGVVKCATQSFLFAACATLLAASFTACFASPASFSALPFAC